MARTVSSKRQHQSIEKQFALAERVLRGLNKTIDDQIERAQDLEVQHALALHKSGKGQVYEADESIQQARQLVG